MKTWDGCRQCPCMSRIMVETMSNGHQTGIYTRYFNLRQKVFLVNMSEERNSEVYESLSGVVSASGMDTLELTIPHVGSGPHHFEVGKTSFKLISESLGNGIQVQGDLTGVVGTVFQLRLHGPLEMFQRRVVPRVDCVARIFQLCGTFTLGHFNKEWKRVITHLRNNGQLQGLVLQKSTINLSAGGIGLIVDVNKRPSPISLFIISLDDDLPVCVLAESVWDKRVEEGLRCGFRFIHILKVDQERINNFVADKLKKSGGSHLDYKRNKMLIDSMG